MKMTSLRMLIVYWKWYKEAILARNEWVLPPRIVFGLSEYILSTYGLLFIGRTAKSTFSWRKFKKLRLSQWNDLIIMGDFNCGLLNVTVVSGSQTIHSTSQNKMIHLNYCHTLTAIRLVCQACKQTLSQKVMDIKASNQAISPGIQSC